MSDGSADESRHRRRRPRLVVTMGCPSGVGPEVIVKALNQSPVHAIVVGDGESLREAARGCGLDATRFVSVRTAREGFALEGAVGVVEPCAPLDPSERLPGTPSLAGGAAQLTWVEFGCDRVRLGEGDALVTAPISKEAIVRSGAPRSVGFIGHTEHLQQRLGADEVIMAFVAEALTTALVTTHLPLSAVPAAITPAAVASATFWLADLLAKLHPGRAPRVAVAGLNPHAGEHGLFGDEEPTRIVPGMSLARLRLAQHGIAASIEGPVPAETAFRLAARGGFDGVVAMYHDQATIPMKLVGFGEAVNVSLGLPIVRTSVDHGTAYDRAGKGTADPRGLVEALILAEKLAPRRG